MCVNIAIYSTIRIDFWVSSKRMIYINLWGFSVGMVSIII